MTPTLRVGVIGAGLLAGLRHLPNLTASPEAEVVAVCRRDPEALGKIAASVGVPTGSRTTSGGSTRSGWTPRSSRRPMDCTSSTSAPRSGATWPTSPTSRWP